MLVTNGDKPTFTIIHHSLLTDLRVISNSAAVAHSLAARLVPLGGFSSGTAVAVGLMPAKQGLSLHTRRALDQSDTYSAYYAFLAKRQNGHHAWEMNEKISQKQNWHT